MNANQITLADLPNNLSVTETKQLMEQLQRQLEAAQPAFEDFTSKGLPRGTRKNTDALLKHYGIEVRYNEMTHNLEIEVPNKEFHADTKLNAQIIHIEDLAVRHELPSERVLNHLILIANENTYHPVREWIDSVEWDGKSRLEEIYDTVTTTNEALKRVLMRKWLISAVAALYHPKFSAEGVLLFSGAQGIGKTKWITRLVGHEDWVRTGESLNTDDKDSILSATGRWLIELGEIGSTYRKNDIDKLKAFITREEDTLRPAYAKTANTYKRHSVFYGSTNDGVFLSDNENRRFWSLELLAINARHNIDVGQLWAELKKIYFELVGKIDNETEYGWYLSPVEREMLAVEQAQFKVDSKIENILEDCVIAKASMGRAVEKLNVTAILKRCGVDNPSQADLAKAGNWLKRGGYEFTAYMRRYSVEFVVAKDSGHDNAEFTKQLHAKFKVMNKAKNT